MARWSDLATWRGPSINSGDGDGRPLEDADALTEVRGLVVHIADGFFEGTIDWQKDPDANTSSHFIAGRAGGRAQMVDTRDRAWAQKAGNSRWLSVECEGFSLNSKLYRPGWEKLTGQQIEFIAQLFARVHTTYNVPLQLTAHPNRPGLGYHSMGAENGFDWGHSLCPGEPIKAQLPAILARAVQIVDEAAEDDTAFVDGRRVAPSGHRDAGRMADCSNNRHAVVWDRRVRTAEAPEFTPAQLDAIATTVGEHAAAAIGAKLDALLTEIRKADEAERAGLHAMLAKLTG